ncbi:mechanosensitive ion channel family protein [Nocardioides jishulii]|nr:mechanosensitive ion channel family protein [Nocardioides jishulii]
MSVLSTAKSPVESAAESPCTDGQAVCEMMLRATGNEGLSAATQVIVTITLLIVLAMVARWFLHRMVDRLVRSAETPMVPNRLVRNGGLGRSVTQSPSDLAATTRRVQRAKTIGSLLKSVITGVLLAVGITMALSELGLNIAPVLASAGIVGLALGFGAQTLVKDFLSGIFMIFEDQYGVGDVIRVNDVQGTVEAVTLRVTRLRDGNGTVWYVRNGEILRVGNMSQNWARAVLDVTVSHEADVTRTREVLLDLAREMWRDDDFTGRIIEEPEVPGVEAISVEGVTVRLSVKTAPMEQWPVARALRERIKARFDAEGIVVPHTRYVEEPVAAE